MTPLNKLEHANYDLKVFYAELNVLHGETI